MKTLIDEFPPASPSDQLRELITTHIRITDELKLLQACKEKCEQDLREWFDHTKSGAQSYDFDKYKIVITTGYNHTLNKDKYADYLLSDERISDKFPVVQEVTMLKINDKMYHNLMIYGDEKDKETVQKFIKTTDKKLHVKIETKTKTKTKTKTEN